MESEKFITVSKTAFHEPNDSGPYPPICAKVLPVVTYQIILCTLSHACYMPCSFIVHHSNYIWLHKTSQILSEYCLTILCAYFKWSTHVDIVCRTERPLSRLMPSRKAATVCGVLGRVSSSLRRRASRRFRIATRESSNAGERYSHTELSHIYTIRPGV
jgi:hypothetical protein